MSDLYFPESVYGQQDFQLSDQYFEQSRGISGHRPIILYDERDSLFRRDYAVEYRSTLEVESEVLCADFCDVFDQDRYLF